MVQCEVKVSRKSVFIKISLNQQPKKEHAKIQVLSMASNHHKVHISNFQNENQEDTACGGDFVIRLDQDSSNIENILQTNLCCLKVLLHYSGFEVSTKDSDLEIKCRFCSVTFHITDGEHFDFDIPENKNACVNYNCDGQILQTILRKHLHSLDSSENQSDDQTKETVSYHATNVSDIFQNRELIAQTLQLINVILKLQAELKQKNSILNMKDLELNKKDSVIEEKDSELRMKDDKIKKHQHLEKVAVSRWSDLLGEIDKLNIEIQEKSQEVLRITEEKSKLEVLVMNCQSQHIEKKEITLLEDKIMNLKIEAGILQSQLREVKEKNKNTEHDLDLDQIKLKKTPASNQPAQDVEPVMEQQKAETETQITQNQSGTPVKASYQNVNQTGVIAFSSLNPPYNPAKSSVNQLGNLTSSSYHQLGNPAKSSYQGVNQPGNPAKSNYQNVNQSGNPAKSSYQGANQPGNPASPSHHQPGNPAKSNYQNVNQPGISASSSVAQPDTPTKSRNKRKKKKKPQISDS
ncbi:hypothetical protein Btru_077441, partial [Bulinus truncatus]